MLIDIYRIKRFFFSRKATVVFYTKENNSDNMNYINELNYIIIDSCNEINYYSKIYNFPIKNEFLERLKLGAILFIILLDDQWVSYGWAARGGKFWISEIDWVIDLKNSESVILYDFYTRSEYRGRGIYPLLLGLICNDLKRKSYIIYSYESNLSSRKGIEKAFFCYQGAFKHKNKEPLHRFLNKYNIEILSYKLHLFDIAEKWEGGKQ